MKVTSIAYMNIETAIEEIVGHRWNVPGFRCPRVHHHVHLHGLLYSATHVRYHQVSISTFYKDLGLTSLRVKPLFDRILIWLFVYGGVAALVQLLYFTVVGS